MVLLVQRAHWTPHLIVCIRKDEMAEETHLIAENLDLACSSVYELVGSRAEVISVNLYVEREALHSLLRGEICAQGVDANIHLQEQKWVVDYMLLNKNICKNEMHDPLSPVVLFPHKLKLRHLYPLSLC